VRCELGRRSSGPRQKQAADVQRNASKLPPSPAPIEAPLELTLWWRLGPGRSPTSPLETTRSGSPNLRLQVSHALRFNMNRFLPFISCAFVGILVSSCAQNPHCVVSEPAYGSASRTPHRPAKRHHVALAQVPLRHPPRRAAGEGQRRPLRPWNHLPAAPETPAPLKGFEIGPPHYWRWQ
jgi:hypothetical protein